MNYKILLKNLMINILKKKMKNLFKIRRINRKKRNEAMKVLDKFKKLKNNLWS